MIELYVFACLSGFCKDFVLETIPERKALPYQCASRVMKLYRKQKMPAYPDYVVRRHGCRRKEEHEARKAK